MSCVWPSDLDNLYLNSFCFGYRQDGSFDPGYLAYMLRADSFRSKVEMLAQGISRFNISKGKVMEIEVPVPDKGEQALIGRFFVDLDNLITLHQRKQGMFGIRNGAWNGVTNPLAFRTPRTASSPSYTPTVARMDAADGADRVAAGSVPMAQTFVCAPGDASAAEPSERPFSLRGMPRTPGGDPFTRLGVGGARQGPIVGPAQFVTRCVTFWGGEVELSPALAVRSRKTHGRSPPAGAWIVRDRWLSHTPRVPVALFLSLCCIAVPSPMPKRAGRASYTRDRPPPATPWRSRSLSCRRTSGQTETPSSTRCSGLRGPSAPASSPPW